MKRSIVSISLLVCMVLFAACAGPNLEQRIDSGMQEFDSWPEEVQQKIRKGEIEVGFTEEQVQMAWGEPDHVTHTRSVTGGDGIEWIWTKDTPAIGIGIGLGKSGSRGGVGGSVGTTVGGKHTVERSVLFQDGVVQSYSE